VEPRSRISSPLVLYIPVPTMLDTTSAAPLEIPNRRSVG
jgi:hypothetical protein